MEISGLKITISQGDSFEVPFALVTDEESVVTRIDPSDIISFVIQESGCRPVLKKSITGVEGTEFSVYVSEEESKPICEGAYEYGVTLRNGNNRYTIASPKDCKFVVKKGVIDYGKPGCY